jgi:hypothetical protein
MPGGQRSKRLGPWSVPVPEWTVTSPEDQAVTEGGRTSVHRRGDVVIRLPGAVFAGYRRGDQLAPDHLVGRVSFEEFSPSGSGPLLPIMGGSKVRAIRFPATAQRTHGQTME